jgi:signal transduction histidine kinase
MLVSGQRGRQRCTHHAAAWAAALTLSACQDGPGSKASGTWLLAGAALLSVCGLAHLWGRQAGRSAAERGLREAHSAARLWRGLQDAYVWRTDAAHSLVSWQAPGLASSQRCALFDAPGPGTEGGRLPEMHDRLQAQAAFSGLHVHRAAEAAGARHWQLAGTPQYDDLGAFAGFVGIARPLDKLDELTTAAAALPALLASDDAAVIVAISRQGTWEVQHASPAARALLPGLGADLGLDHVLAALPETARLAAQRLLQAPAQSLPTARPTPDGEAAAGWRFEPFGPLPDGGAGLVMALRTAGSSASLAQAADNAESEQFSFSVTHDLRAPIRVVEGFARIVKEDYGRLLDRVGNDHLDRVLGAAARMNLMIDALLTLAKLSTQPLAQQTVNLSQQASWVMDELARGAPEREAEIDIEPGLTTRGDPTLLRLVLENLLGNAWKYSARCPRTQISLRRVPHGQGTAYVVRDNGAGFDMRSADRLFGLFQRLHSASEFPGHGVGLASVRRIVRRHGGEVWAESEPGRGAAFYFTLNA